MNDVPAAATPEAHGNISASAEFKSYMAVFVILCICTALSFAVNHALGQNHTSMLIILGVAVIKALCVAIIFMHLRADWGKVFFICIPVTIMGVMMIIVLLPDIVLGWHATHIPALDSDPLPIYKVSTPAKAPGAHH